MSRTVVNSVVFNSFKLAAFAALLGGCGLVQKVADGTASTTRGIFYTEVKTLRLDLSTRAAINTDDADTSGLSVPTLVRVYQLRGNKALEKAPYEGLLNDDESLLGADLLDKRTLVVKPEEGMQLNMPLDKDAQFVAVVALVRAPDTQLDSWRLTLARAELDPDQARVIELGDSRLVLRPLAEE